MKIQVKVKPNSKHQQIKQSEDGSWLIRLKSPPVDGKANRELIGLLATKFKVTKAQVTIRSGLSSKHKLIEIEK